MEWVSEVSEYLILALPLAWVSWSDVGLDLML